MAFSDQFCVQFDGPISWVLAPIGKALLTALLAWDFIVNVLNVGRGLVPAVILFSSIIYAFGALSVVVLFYVFHKARS